MSWYLAVLKKYAEFSGRARRKEYQMFALFNFIFRATTPAFQSGVLRDWARRHACRQPGSPWHALRLGCSDSEYCRFGQKVA